VKIADHRISVKPLGLEHLNDLMRLEAACFPRIDQLSIHQYMIDFERHGAQGVVVLVDKKVAGVAVFEFPKRRKSAYLSSLAVDPKYRGNQLGERMMWTVEHLAKHHGYRYVQLHVRASNEHAQGLYSRLGYRHSSIDFKHYADEAGWRMRKLVTA
jgi:ribosomal protein S18 acetylase RimI-like enzyme